MKNKYSCIIVEDEPLAVDVIQTHLNRLGMFELIATCGNAMEAMTIISSQKVDLIFLDIQLPGIKGIDFLKGLNQSYNVILTTAYREYALDGFNLNVIDFLLKPISFDRFSKAINKFLQKEAVKLLGNIKSIDAYSEDMNECVYITVNKRVYKIDQSSINYVESIRDYVTVHTKDEKITFKHTLSAIEELLPKSHFFRIHRSYLVALKCIKSFTPNSIDIGVAELPIGRSYQEKVLTHLNFPRL